VVLPLLCVFRLRVLPACGVPPRDDCDSLATDLLRCCCTIAACTMAAGCVQCDPELTQQHFQVLVWLGESGRSRRSEVRLTVFRVSRLQTLSPIT